MLIRHADPSRDARACAAIYAPFVRDTPVSFEERPPSEAEIAERIAAVSQDYPWLVAEVAGEVVGYAYACAHRDRAPTAGPPTSRPTWRRDDAVRGWDAPSMAG